MPHRRIEIEPTLLCEVERIRKREGVSVSQIVNEALAIVLVERRRRLQAPVFPCLPRPTSAGSRLADRDEIFSVLDF